jgi:glycine hydroxymethyltransferase
MTSLQHQDPTIWSLLEEERKRQATCLELIASENATSPAVLEALGSIFTNKYAEGQPGRRYYGGTEVVDKLERLCQKRALAAFDLSAEEWAVNVQPYSGSVANMAVYLGLLQPGDVLMGLDLPSGGHLSHGYATAKRKITAAATYYTSIPYKVAPDSGLLDYDAIALQAELVRPKLLICGASAYSRDWDYGRLRPTPVASSPPASSLRPSRSVTW